MAKTIAVLGALDTKGQEFAFLRLEIEKRGCRALVINVGVLGAPLFQPEISADQIAAAGGGHLTDLVARHDRGQAMEVMNRGAAVLVKKLYGEGKFDGIISMGGGGGTGIAASAMRALPVGVPKVLVSTVASGDISPYVGTTDITMMPSIVDIAGLNRISRIVFSNAAGAICGMVTGKVERSAEDKPLIAATMFGNTTRAVDIARKILEMHGYEVLVFHATGTGGRTMEMLIENGYFAGVLDMTTTEWADEICGGVFSAGSTRMEAAAKAGVPEVITPACVDMCNFGAPETVPAKYKDRLFYRWNPNVTLMRTTIEENAKLGQIFAEKLNSAKGPVAVFIPMGGFSEMDYPGQPFWWPEADQGFLDALKKHLRPDIPVELSDKDVNHPEFASRTAEKLLEFLEVDNTK
ncbi:MAG: Tm-1-like ATP-binding domain-containing protein [Verrucomicrobia bacterium]|nr:Tm-1-like ATP-binding domain-containing protein [Verrucomicrobiota bacterium]